MLALVFVLSRRQPAAYLTDQQAQIGGVTYTEAPFEIVLEDNALEGNALEDNALEDNALGGLTITGRNDVIWQQDGEETRREIKSRREAQSEEITRVQRYVEDLGFHASTGRHVVHLEAYNLSGGVDGKPGVQFREAFNPRTSEAVKERLREAGRTIRRRELLRLPVYGATCQHCGHPGFCRDRNEAG